MTVKERVLIALVEAQTELLCMCVGNAQSPDNLRQVMLLRMKALRGHHLATIHSELLQQAPQSADEMQRFLNDSFETVLTAIAGQ